MRCALTGFRVDRRLRGGPVVLGLALVAALAVGPACGAAPLKRTGQAGVTPSSAPGRQPAPTAVSALVVWAPGATVPDLAAPAASPPAPRRYWHWRIQTGGAVGLINERWVGYSAKDPSYFPIGGSLRAADPADWAAHRLMVEGRALTFDELNRLPTDPTGMGAFLSEPYHTTAFTARIFGEAVELAIAPTPPLALAAAFRAISERPEVNYAGKLADPLGRPGIGLVFEYGEVQNQLIVDPRTGGALANRAVSMRDGSIQLSTVVLTAEWTDSVPAA
jgi:hypothetical protein